MPISGNRYIDSLDGGTASNVHLIEPLQYFPFLALLERSTIILIDSGEIKEEAPSLGKPILVMRESTEQQEAVDAETVILIGTKRDSIFNETVRILANHEFYAKMALAQNPYYDGNAATRIVKILTAHV